MAGDFLPVAMFILHMADKYPWHLTLPHISIPLIGTQPTSILNNSSYHDELWYWVGVCRDCKEFAKNWSTLTSRVKTCAEWNRQISKFDITSTDIYRDILHTQGEISSQSVFKISTNLDQRKLRKVLQCVKNCVDLKGGLQCRQMSVTWMKGAGLFNDDILKGYQRFSCEIYFHKYPKFYRLFF